MDRASPNLQCCLQPLISNVAEGAASCANWASENRAPLMCPPRLVVGFTLTSESLAHYWRLQTTEAFIVSSNSPNDVTFQVSVMNG